jgi:regulator of replication initiation timing
MIAENTDINILKSAINNLIQENKQLLESNEQLKKEDSKLRNYIINIAARELETQIQLISGWSKLLLEHYKSPQQFSHRVSRFKILPRKYKFRDDFNKTF